MTAVENVEPKINNGQSNVKEEKPTKTIIIWPMVIFFAIKHILALYGLYLVPTKAMWKTTLFTLVLVEVGNVGVIAGAHRLWSHNAYKVKWPLKLILLTMYTLSFQGSVHQWARDHRVHHKYSDTDADPHNSTRGFFFSHVGWLLVKKHPELITKGRTIDLSDLVNDTLLQIQRKYYYYFVFLISFCMPLYVTHLWGEDVWTSFFVAVMLRHCLGLHCIFLINSAAHMWGYKPYDASIQPAENKVVAVFAAGEGFHNYHHTFPWDYRSAEFGGYTFNTSWWFIDMMAKIGWAYDLKTTTKEIIEKRVIRTGDGSHPVWGWNDKDLRIEEKVAAKIL